MEQSDPRRVIETLAVSFGESLAALSRLLGRNDAYLQQFVKCGTPRLLAERDRRILAAYFRVEEVVLGGPVASAPTPTPTPKIAVRLLNIAASAGPGRLVEAERATATLPFDRAMLERLGIRSSSLAMIDAAGDSMAPVIEHGDRIMVDEADRRVDGRGAIYVLRIDGTLVVKRVVRAGDRLKISSDNPDYPALPDCDADDVEIIGKVVWLSRALR
jgi:repressor LexA